MLSAFCVALLAEGVDRNLGWVDDGGEEFAVALLAEGVDRNMLAIIAFAKDAVALLAEGVDRNTTLAISAAVVASRPPRGGRG